MDNKEAIRRIRDHMRIHQIAESRAVKITEALEMAIAALEQTTWYCVSERSPEDLMDVLTCDCKGNMHIMRDHCELPVPFGIKENDMRFYPPTHWMKLPAPPKEIPNETT